MLDDVLGSWCAYWAFCSCFPCPGQAHHGASLSSACADVRSGRDAHDAASNEGGRPRPIVCRTRPILRGGECIRANFCSLEATLSDRGCQPPPLPNGIYYRGRALLRAIARKSLGDDVQRTTTRRQVQPNPHTPPPRHNAQGPAPAAMGPPSFSSSHAGGGGGGPSIETLRFLHAQVQVCAWA